MNYWNRLIAGLALAVAGAAYGQSLPWDNNELGNSTLNARGMNQQPLSKLDQAFVLNKGQWNNRALFKTESPGLTYWATKTGFVIDAYRRIGEGAEASQTGHVVMFDIVGAKGTARPVGIGDKGVKIDYITQISSSKVDGVQNSRAYTEGIAKNILPGVDFRHYRDGGMIRHDLILAPGVDPKSIKLNVSGASNIIRQSDGTVAVVTNVGNVQLDGLEAYQMIDGQKRSVRAGFKIDDFKTLAFEVGNFDKSRPLIIDPLVYGTYFGGGGTDSVNAVASDSAGSVFLCGTTTSPDLPVTAGPYLIEIWTTEDGFVAGLTEDAYEVNYVAYLSGFGKDSIRGAAVDQYGDLWVGGITNTRYFGTTTGSITLTKRDPEVWGEPHPQSTFWFTFVNPTGSFEESDPISVFSTAAEVKASLDAMPNAPASGFTVTGGPLPDNDMEITWEAKEGIGPLAVQQPVRQYLCTEENPPIQDIFMEDGDGLIPTFGGFTLSGTDNNNAAFTTGGIPFDAAGPGIAGAIQATTPFADGNPLVIGLGGPLPLNACAIGFFDPTNNNPFNLATMTVNGTGLRGGGFDLGNQQGKLFALRFKRSATQVLDPISVPTVITLRGGGLMEGDPNGPAAQALRFSSFAIRPASPNTGPIDFVLAGTTVAPMDDLITQKPANRRAGFFVVGRANNATGAIQTFSGRQGYVTGGLEVLNMDATIDINGAVYCAGTLQFNTNATLSTTSNIFYATSPIWPNGNTLRFNDGFLRKYNANGTIAYSGVYGSAGNDNAVAVALDAANNVYITGVAGANSFPRTVGTFDDVFASGKPYVIKINSGGTSYIYTTALRSVATPVDLEVDTRGNAYVGLVAQSRPAPFPSDFIAPTPNNPAITGQEAALDPALTNQPPNLDSAIMVLNSSATGCYYGSYIGPDNVGPFPSNESLRDVFIDKSNGVWITGVTDGLLQNQFITPNAFQIGPNGFGSWIIKQKIGLPVLRQLTLSPTTIPASLGASSDLNVVLAGPAPAPGVSIKLKIVDPNVARFNDESGPGDLTVNIATGQTTLAAPIKVFSRRTGAPTSTVIRAEMDGDLVQNRLSVVPWLASFTLGDSTVRGGNQVAATVRLIQPAPAGGVTLNMTTDSPQLVSYPNGGAISIPAGDDTATFFVDTQGVDANSNATLVANLAGASITRTLTLTPAVISGFSIDPDRVTGGEQATGTITLDGKAGGNTIVRLSQVSGVAVGFEKAIQVPRGASTATLPIATDYTPADATAVIAATLGGFVASDSLLVLNNQIESITLSQNTVEGGATVTGTVRLTKPAGPTGIRIPLQNSNPAVGTLTPTTVVIPSGAITGTFSLATINVLTQQTVRITANKPDYARPFAVLTVNPFVVNVTVSIAPSSVSGGSTSTGTITLSRPAPAGGFNAALSSNNGAAQVPAIVNIPSGSTSRTFQITTSPVGATTVARITAVVGANSGAADITILPAAITGFFFTPAGVRGGSGSMATINIDTPAPAGGLPIGISADLPQFVSFPTSVVVPAGARSVSFNVGTNTVTRIITVTFTATVSGRAPVTTTLTLSGTP